MECQFKNNFILLFKFDWECICSIFHEFLQVWLPLGWWVSLLIQWIPSDNRGWTGVVGPSSPHLWFIWTISGPLQWWCQKNKTHWPAQLGFCWCKWVHDLCLTAWSAQSALWCCWHWGQRCYPDSTVSNGWSWLYKQCFHPRWWRELSRIFHIFC